MIILNNKNTRKKKEANVFDFFYTKKKQLKKPLNEKLKVLQEQKFNILISANAPRSAKGNRFMTARTQAEWDNQEELIRIRADKIWIWRDYYEQKAQLLNECCDVLYCHDYPYSAKILKAVENFKNFVGYSFSKTQHEAYKKAAPVL